MTQDWLPGAPRVPSSHDGGSMIGGSPRFVWHTYEANPNGLSADRAARALISAGNEVHFTLNPLTGDLVQILPASRAARGLMNTPGGVETNRMGATCLQVEVIAFAANPWTNYCTAPGWAAVGRLVAFAREHGIPDSWPAGPPPVYPPGNGNRSAGIWTSRAGHYGHSQVPENTHGDPGAIDVARIFAASETVASTPTGEDTDMRLVEHPGDKAVYLLGLTPTPLRISTPDVEPWRRITGQALPLPSASGAMIQAVSVPVLDYGQLADALAAKGIDIDPQALAAAVADELGRRLGA